MRVSPGRHCKLRSYQAASTWCRSKVTRVMLVRSEHAVLQWPGLQATSFVVCTGGISSACSRQNEAHTMWVPSKSPVRSRRPLLQRTRCGSGTLLKLFHGCSICAPACPCRSSLLHYSIAPALALAHACAVLVLEDGQKPYQNVKACC